MEYGLFDVLTLLGALGFFLFGMKLMSESLQRAAGDKMRSILAAMTSNKFRGVFTGFLITAIIQSSSASTVMLVSFVNAGLITLGESIGVVMGTNIGTTVTAWLISLLGFKVNISQLALPLIGLSLPFLFSKSKSKSNWGNVIIGFAIIFIGLDFLQDATPDIRNNPGILEFLTQYSNYGFLSVIIFLFIGTALTTIIQSSSATMALTLVMCYNGWISFEMAAAMVLGQNIGTTVTANLAALVANTSARRTAAAHFVFNAFGVLLVLITFFPFLRMIDWITIQFGLTSPFPKDGQTAKQTAEAIPVALSIFHTVFNILNTAILIGFVPLIEKIVTVMVRQRDNDDDFKLQYINTGLLSTVELSILQAQREINIYANRVRKMFNLTKEIVAAKTDSNHTKLFNKIQKYEEASDSLELEIATYLIQITGERVSSSSTESINNMLNLISNLESFADSCYSIARAMDRKNDSKVEFIPELDINLEGLLSNADKMLNEMMKSFEDDSAPSDLETINVLFDKQRKNWLKLNTEHYKNLRKGNYKTKVGIIYSDICVELSKLSEYIKSIAEISSPDENIKS